MHSPSGLLAQILARPDDDIPRLVYADWVDDLGNHPRAEFIRTQLAVAGLPPGDRRRVELTEREERLLKEYAHTWTEPLAGIATAPLFHRGFVHSVNQSARQFLSHSAELFEFSPIRELYLLDLGGQLDAVFDSLHLARLSGLTVFAQHQGEPIARAVAESRRLMQLHRLDLGRNEIGCDGLRQLAESPFLIALRELDLSSNELDSRGLGYVAERSNWQQLQRLELAENMLTAAAVERLIHSDRHPRLYRLGLSGNRLWSYQRDPLPDAAALFRVPILDLRNNGLTADGLRILLSSDRARVRELDLGRNCLRDDGALLLAGANTLSEVRVLKLAANQITDVGLRALADSRNFGRLTVLDVSNNPVGDGGVRAVVESRHLPALRHFIYPSLGLSFRLRTALREQYPEG